MPDPIENEEDIAAHASVDIKDRQSRADAAVQMRLAGANYSDIARVLDYSNTTMARKAIESALANTGDESDKDRLRTIIDRRLDRLLRSTWKKSTDADDPQHLAYVRTSLALIDRQIRLHGLDAPQELNVYSPSRVEIDEYLTIVSRAMHAEYPEEADVLDGEVIESGVIQTYGDVLDA